MQQGSESFRLVVRRGPQPNQVYDLNKDVQTIGRDITNDIVINDPEVSRHHIRFTRGAGGFTMEDIGSTNGTYVNGQRLVGAKPLNNGDLIGLGETVTLGYEVVRAAPPDDPASAATMANPAAQAPYSPTYQQPPQQQQPYGQQPPQQGSPYAPPGQQPPQQQGSPYAPPGQQGSPYGQQPQQPGRPGQQPPQQPASQQAYSYSPPPAYGAQGQPGEYVEPEEDARSPMRWILIGCIGLLLFCCCGTVLALLIIDSACLWDNLPIISDVINAVGLVSTCP